MAAPPAFADIVAEHAVVQQGLAIALASNVLQSHLIYVSAALGEYNGWVGVCTALDDTDIHSGGVTAVADPPGAGQNFPALVHTEIYYDGTCATPYMTADVALTETLVGSMTAYSVTDLHTHYFAIDGVSPLATLTTTATVSYDTDTSTLALHGLGAFAGAASPASASLGLVCGTASDAVDLDCAGGIVQDFPSLGVALGSVSPLTLVANDDGSLDFSSTTPAAFSSGAEGALVLAYGDATDASLVVNGGGAYGSDTVSGHVATFSLLPPPPTLWASDDTVHDLHFAISVTDPDTRSLDILITRISDGGALGAGHLDQSGTGSVTFSDGSSTAVVGWILADGAADAIFGDGFDP
ncbi:MAG TPA: hypothetical protein VGO25_05505 [Rhodanobacteraceae bacterium]|jgi:hypothetical protein|nr:hypothetical protein [Rhodanobacteraceae bacterium]